MLKLTKRQRNRLHSLAKRLYSEGVDDEHKSIAFYKRMAEELRVLNLRDEAKVLDSIIESEEIHKKLLNEIVEDLKEKVILSQFKKETTLKGNKSFRVWRR